jgi:GDP-mannose 4,6-dehydratase
MSSRKKVLITGITGMVGSHLADLLIKETDWIIYGMCRWRSPLSNVQHLLKLANSNTRLHFIYGDLCDALSINKVIKETKPDYVYHLAAQSYPQTSFYMSDITMDTNTNGTLRLLEAIKENNLIKKTLIHICSSSEVFGKVPKNMLPINEKCGYHPASPYAISKVGTDLFAKYYHEAYGLKVLTTRMFTHTGPRRGDVFAESSFAKQIALIEAGFSRPIIKVGNLESLRTFADVRDAVNAYYLLLTKNPKSGEFYNIGGEFTCKVGEMLKFLINLSNKKNEIKILKDKKRMRPIDADLQIPDTSKFKKKYKWKPKYSFEQTMTDLLNYWREEIKKNGSQLDR